MHSLEEVTATAVLVPFHELANFSSYELMVFPVLEIRPIIGYWHIPFRLAKVVLFQRTVEGVDTCAFVAASI